MKLNQNNNSRPFDIKALLKASWDLVDGSKWPIWAPLLLFVLISIGINLIFSLLFPLLGLPALHGSFTKGFTVGYVITAVIIKVITIFITAPLIAGAQMVALKRVRGETLDHMMGFQYWSLWINLGITLIIVTLGFDLINVIFGFLISLSYNAGYWLVLILQGLALIAFILYYAFFIFAMLFIADKENNPVEALVNCYKMVKPHWLHVAGVILCLAIGFLIILLPYYLFSIAGYAWVSWFGALISIVLAIWAIPWFHLIVSNVYHKLQSSYPLATKEDETRTSRLG